MRETELVIPEDIPPERLPDLLRNWFLGSKARRYMSTRRFGAVTTLACRGRAGRALDVGCGWGYNLYLLHASGFDPWGIDIVQNDFHTTLAVAGANGYPVTLAGADVSRLPFPENSFSAVTAVETFEHIFGPDRPLAAAEVARVLEPGGTVALSTPNYGSLIERAKRLIVRFPLLKRAFPAMCYPAGEIGRAEYHPYRYHKPLRPGDLVSLLEGAGLTVTSNRVMLFVLKNVPDALFPVWKAVEWILERTPGVRRLGSTLVVSARKGI